MFELSTVTKLTCRGKPRVRNYKWDGTKEGFLKCLRPQPNGCLNYQTVGGGGYGVVKHNGRFWRAHRVAWILFKGGFPADLCVLHRCDNRACCNVDHLFLGTNKDNTQDCINKGRFVGNLRIGKERIDLALRLFPYREILGQRIAGFASLFGISLKHFDDVRKGRIPYYVKLGIGNQD